MDNPPCPTKTNSPIYIVSGSVGSSGEQLVRTVLAQFPGVEVPVVKVPHTRQFEQIQDVVAQAVRTGGTIVHTLVNARMRKMLVDLGEKHQVVMIDVMGDLLDRLAEALGTKPVGKPGLYRQLRQDYFDRVSAIEFTMAHDDGQKPEGLAQAEIILTGVSRVGKTPLSVYLSVLGWKVANVPLVEDLDPPPQLLSVDRRRVFGLTVDAAILSLYRKTRMARLGLKDQSTYINPKSISREVEYAERVFHQQDFTVIHMTNKPIESSANEITEIITKRFKRRFPKTSQER